MDEGGWVDGRRDEWKGDEEVEEVGGEGTEKDNEENFK